MINVEGEMKVMDGDTCGSSDSCGSSVMGRRQFLLGGGSLVAAGAAAGIVTAANSTVAQAQEARQPNIVYIVADDMGWKDVGFHGSDIKTPNLDKLAETGAPLEQFYVLPMCTPTRAALMTGRYPLRYGLQTGVIPAAGQYSLPLDEYLLPQVLKDAGYKTAMSGKWHLGHAKTEFWPRQRGFDSFYGATVGEIDHFTHSSHGVKDWYRNNKPIKEKGFDNSLFGAEAVRVIDKHDQKAPLFLYLAFTAPHTPFQAPQEYIDRFKSIADENRRKYAAMISVMDDEIGNVVAALEKRGMRENTLIVFHSDNGGVLSSLFAGDSKVGGKLPADNGPYRDGKGTLFEGGTRAAALINWPGKIKPGANDSMMHVTDLYPTLAGLAGAKLGKNKPLDGVDVWPTISEGKPSPRSEIVYNIDPLAGAVRQGDWKLVWKAALPPMVSLFDLAKDKSEATNLADKNPDKVKELQARITQLATEMAPPMLIMEAIRLTFYTPPVMPDVSQMFNLGD
jgi:arylsulfatase A-like enzyme